MTIHRYKVSTAEQQAIVRLYRQGLPYTQIEAKVGRSVGSISAIVTRARKAGDLDGVAVRRYLTGGLCECGQAKKVDPIWGCRACMLWDKFNASDSRVANALSKPGWFERQAEAAIGLKNYAKHC